MFARETFAGFLPLFYKSRRRRAICSANRKCSKKKHHPSGWCFFLLCVDKKDATFPVVRKERDACRGNLSRVNTVAALRFAAIQTPQIAPLPRNGFASSAAGGASPVSPCFLIPPQDKFAKQTCPLQKRNTTHWVVFLFGGAASGLTLAAAHRLVERCAAAIAVIILSVFPTPAVPSA